LVENRSPAAQLDALWTYLIERGEVTKDWLRVSHRKLDQERSTAYRPYHRHDELQFLTAGEVVPVAIEIWPRERRGGNDDHGATQKADT
jgi:predicted acyl esterase